MFCLRACSATYGDVQGSDTYQDQRCEFGPAGNKVGAGLLYGGWAPKGLQDGCQKAGVDSLVWPSGEAAASEPFFSSHSASTDLEGSDQQPGAAR